MKLFLTALFCCLGIAHAQSKAELQNLQYSAERQDGRDFKIKFLPPANHHFNMDAPSLVTQTAASFSEKAVLAKKPSEVIGQFASEKPGCEIKTELYLCDDKNTYCVPIKKTFSCENLKKKGPVTGIDSVEKSSAPNEKMQSSEEQFVTNDYETAFAQASQRHKMLLIDFYGIWCPPCNILNETVFPSKEFRKVAKDFVLLKMDADNPISFNLKSKFNIKGYPTVILANSSGEEVSRIVGSRKPAVFIQEMRSALKLRSQSLAQRISRAESLKDSEAAFSLAKMYLDQEEFANANKFALLGLKNGTLNNEQRRTLLAAQLKLLKESAKDSTSQRALALQLETTLSTDPTGIFALDNGDSLLEIAEELKDEGMKNRAQNAKFKNSEHLLTHPKEYENSELTEADLHVTLAGVYESLKDGAKMKLAYSKAVAAYEKAIKASGLPADAERGNNLERLYCLFKSGQSEEAFRLYEQFENKYPNEFTFYYSHASLLKEAGNKELAAKKAEKALEFSYGDNQLRAAHLLADLQTQLGNKKAALALIDQTVQKFPEVKDLRVRSLRYLNKLKNLKVEIEKL